MSPFGIIDEKLYQIERGMDREAFGISDISDLLPASVMVHNLVEGLPQEIVYMNRWGCENLGVELEALNAMQAEYYDAFFIQEDLRDVLPRLVDFCRAPDTTGQLNFFQRVKLYGEKDHRWFYSVCKLLDACGDPNQRQLLMLSSPIAGVGTLMDRVKKVLDENEYITRNYRKFASLTRREKEIISLLGLGRSSPEIADMLFISRETVASHRKNILRKLQAKSFADLLRFAIAFELVEG